jgi:hypothetical protein
MKDRILDIVAGTCVVLFILGVFALRLVPAYYGSGSDRADTATTQLHTNSVMPTITTAQTTTSTMLVPESRPFRLVSFSSPVDITPEAQVAVQAELDAAQQTCTECRFNMTVFRTALAVGWSGPSSEGTVYSERFERVVPKLIGEGAVHTQSKTIG